MYLSDVVVMQLCLSFVSLGLRKGGRASGSSHMWTSSGLKQGALNWNCLLSRMYLIRDH